MRRLILRVPGLLGPELPPGAPPEAAAAMAVDLRVPATERLLARAERIGPAGSLEADLFALAGLEPAATGDLPAAAVSLLGEGADPGDGWWLRADPVHLRADIGDLVLLDPGGLALDDEDARALVATLDEHFAADGLRLEVRAPDRWYLRLDAPAAITTSPPERAVGRPVSTCLPTGPDATAWHGRANEAQMLLHTEPVNAARAARGLAPVNSLWLWGGGALPERRSEAAIDALVGAGVLGRGLAELASATWQPLPEHLDAVQVEGTVAVVLDDLAKAARATDVEGWRAALEAFESRWAVPALAALRAGRLDVVEVRSARTGRLELTRPRSWRFWRRSRPIAALLGASAGDR